MQLCALLVVKVKFIVLEKAEGKMYPKATSSSCMQCDEVITEPICADCLAIRMKVVVKEYDSRLAQEIVGFTSIEGGATCLFCGEKMSLCAHCFSREIYDLIKTKNPSLVEEFLSRFDFGLRREVSS